MVNVWRTRIEWPFTRWLDCRRGNDGQYHGAENMRSEQSDVLTLLIGYCKNYGKRPLGIASKEVPPAQSIEPRTRPLHSTRYESLNHAYPQAVTALVSTAANWQLIIRTDAEFFADRSCDLE